MQIRAASRLVLIFLASCSVYDPSLLEGSGGAGGGGGGQGGAPACDAPADCPGADDECQQRTCVMGACGATFTMLGTALSTQAPGDCQKVVCDGMGGTTQEPDDSDKPDDGKECTTDTCEQGVPTYTPVAESTACTQGGGKVCNALGACVECVTGADCPSMVCDASFTCAPPGCTDKVKNGLETDIDCGGGVCADCPSGKACKLDGDCIGGSCAMSLCAPTCTDQEKNNGESDVDCGGPNCGKCDFGEQCTGGADCDTGNCQNNACACVGTCACDHLVISEIRTRGASGASDEFVELYNTTASPITLDNQWKLEVRSSNASNYASRWVGAGQVIAPKGHLLITGSAYTQMPAGDALLSSGITDAASLRLVHAGNVVDAVCFCFNATTCDALSGAGYTCEGMTVDNLPHNDNNSTASNSDVGIERKPGDALGNCTDTGDGAADFTSGVTPTRPQSTTSPTTP